MKALECKGAFILENIVWYNLTIFNLISFWKRRRNVEQPNMFVAQNLKKRFQQMVSIAESNSNISSKLNLNKNVPLL